MKKYAILGAILLIGVASYAWAGPSVSGGGGSGDVAGPASSTADHVATFSDTSGKVLKDGGVLVTSSAATSGGPFVLGLTNENPAKTKEVTLDAHLSLTGTTAPALAVVAVEVDGHTDGTNLTAASMTGPGAVIYNTGQGAGDVSLNLPTAAAGLSALFCVGTTVAANKWRVRAAANDKIYNMAADGTPTAGSDNGYVGYSTTAKYPVIGNCFAVWSFKTDAYDWIAKPIGNIVLTAE